MNEDRIHGEKSHFALLQMLMGPYQWLLPAVLRKVLVPAMFMYYAGGQEPFSGTKQINLPAAYCKPPVRGMQAGSAIRSYVPAGKQFKLSLL